jgi:hypothetical protein
MNTLTIRVQKTIDYLNSMKGRCNWALNVGRGYTDEQNLFAAVQTATRLIKYENIIEVLGAVRGQIKSNKAVA